VADLKKGCINRDVTDTDLLFFARGAAELTGNDLQIFPPGAQVVSPTPASGGEAKEMTLVIDEATATALELSRATYQAKADAGEGDAPYLDFNHADGEASAWPKRIYWAGADPKTGGVRAEVEWSSAGQEAVAGKTFRRFSPAFYARDGKVTGAPVNMGGLVNRAAFTKIQPLFARLSDPTPPPIMTPEETTALQAENADLKKQLEELQACLTKKDEALMAYAKADAEATVALAAKEGRIAPAAEVQEKWVAALLSNPESKELLLAMAPHPALKPIITGKATDQEIVEDAVALFAKFEALPRDEQTAFFAAHKATLISLRR
jgi:hypothetical protein